MQDKNQSRAIRHRKRRKILVTVLALILVVAAAGTAYGYIIFRKAASVTQQAHNNLGRGSKSDLRTAKVDPVKDNFSLLFIGIDKRKNEPARSDAMILATFNHDRNEVKMVSIPRDSKVQIYPQTPTDYGITKITHAHAYGDTQGNRGADYTIDTIEHLLQIPVDYYVQVDFRAFVRIIDALGGVDVDVPAKLVTQNSKDQHGSQSIVLQPGKQTLNGEQALALARNRKSPGSGGDFGRGKRQMAIIKALVAKSKQLTSITKYGNVIDSLNGHLQTNLTFGQLLSLKQYAGSLSSIQTIQLKGTDDISTGTYYYALDETYLQKVRNQLQQQLDYTPTAEDSETSAIAGSDASESTAP